MLTHVLHNLEYKRTYSILQKIVILSRRTEKVVTPTLFKSKKLELQASISISCTSSVLNKCIRYEDKQKESQSKGSINILKKSNNSIYCFITITEQSVIRTPILL